MGLSLPNDIFVTIIQDYVSDDKDTLRSLSLVSRSLCDAVQRVLFHSVIFFHDYLQGMDNKSHPFKWLKLEFLAGSNNILRYIRILTVVISYDPNLPINESDTYWQEAGGRPLLDTLDRLLPSCIDRMSSLSKINYSGPALRAPMHQAILRNKTLQTLVVSAKTHCSVPCKDALQKNVGVGSIRKLQIIELGNELGELGIVGAGLYSTGPRRCVFLSHMILTHSASLRVLTVAITLLYDALKPFSPHNLPDFPNLSSLQIDDSKSSLALEALLPTMSTIVVKFILHVHQTLDILRWGLNVTESMTKEITADHLPNLTKLSGYKIQHLTRLHRVKVLGIMGLCPSDFDSEKDWSLLRETSTRLPDLSTLAVSTIVQLTAILHDIRIFTNIVDLWYEELSGCIPYHYESQTREDFIFEFVHIVLPALPKLRQFCITADGSVLDSGANIRSTEEVLSSSRSLLRLTIQYVLQARACYRFDACRNDVQSEWTYEPFEGFEYLRKFSL